jgi:hypothetical protein
MSFYDTQKKNGYNLVMVVTVGDNFYYDGQDCSMYSKRWSKMYGEIATHYPWLAVFGNHDWGKHDPNAICAWGVSQAYIDGKTGIPYAANQLNSDKKGCNPFNYYLPDFGYYYTLDALDLELIFMEETATICPSDMGGQTYKSCNDSSKIGCAYLGEMRDASEDMMLARARSSTHSNFMLMQHYPQNGKRLPDSFASHRPSSATDDLIWSFYGHTHKQECVRTSKGACDVVLTGGGGGCCGEDTLRGFYVIGFDSQSRMTQPYSIDDPLISCKYPCKRNFAQEFTEQEILQSMYGHCCYRVNDDGDRDESCDMFDLTQC